MSDASSDEVPDGEDAADESMSEPTNRSAWEEDMERWREENPEEFARQMAKIRESINAIMLPASRRLYDELYRSDGPMMKIAAQFAGIAKSQITLTTSFAKTAETISAQMRKPFADISKSWAVTSPGLRELAQQIAERSAAQAASLSALRVAEMPHQARGPAGNSLEVSVSDEGQGEDDVVAVRTPPATKAISTKQLALIAALIGTLLPIAESQIAMYAAGMNDLDRARITSLTQGLLMAAIILFVVTWKSGD